MKLSFDKLKFALFAAYVAINWLESKEFSDSGLSPIEFLVLKKRKFIHQIKSKQ